MKYTLEQQNAINTIDNNLQIIACAGAGKTQVISQRVVEILKQDDVDPKNIIAFTYTEKAAAELKTRILKLCREQLEDPRGLAEMYVGTIHSWCLQAIQDNIFKFQKYNILDQVQLKLFVDKYYNDVGMPGVGMERFKDTDRFMAIMSLFREAEIREGFVLPSEWQDALEDYEDKLHHHSFFDFTMIMTEAIHSLQNDPEFKEKIFGNLKYLIVDEYQDVNPVQETLIQELSKSDCNICVVGDDDQTLYEWRSSDVRYIQQFQKRYPNVDYQKLEDNFRSSKGVIDTALSCISNNENRLPKVMNAKGHQNFERGDIIYNQYEDVDSENRFIAETIFKLRGKAFQDRLEGKERGLDYSDCVVLLRTWKKAHSIMETLTEYNIPFVVSGVNNLFDRPEIKASQAIYQYLDNTIEEDSLVAYWMAVTENITESNIRNAVSVIDSMRPKKNKYYNSFNIQSIFWKFLEEAKLSEEVFAEEGNDGIVGNEINEVIYYNLGMFSQIINDFENIHFRDKPIYKLKNFLNFLRYSADGYYPEGWLNNSYRTPNAVQIMTIFQSKGLEYPAVFVPGLNKNYLPIKKPGGKQIWHYIERDWIQDQERLEGSTESERRLFYVAITRSQKYLFLTRSVENRLYQKESLFAKELVDSDYILTDYDPDYSHLADLKPTPKAETSAIQLNFSVLKAFFDCPYRFKLISLYGFVQPISEAVGYGNSVHNVLMELHRKFLDGKDILKENIQEIVDTHTHMPFATKRLFENSKERVLNVTEDYLKDNLYDFKNIEYAEKEIQIDLGDGILVNGRMDLIKKRNSGGNDETTIIDFKSQKDSQAKDITIEQLSMYALGYRELTGRLADNLQIFNLDVDGHSKTEQSIDNTRLEEISQKISHSANEIRDNKLNKTCEVKTCEECYYNAICSGVKAN